MYYVMKPRTFAFKNIYQTTLLYKTQGKAGNWISKSSVSLVCLTVFEENNRGLEIVTKICRAIVIVYAK